MFGVKEQWHFWVCLNLYLLALLQPLTQAMIPKDPGHEMVSSTSLESGLTALLTSMSSPIPNSEIESPWCEHSLEKSSFDQKFDRPKRNIVELTTTGPENHITNSKKAKFLAGNSRETDIFPASSISSVFGASPDLNNHQTQYLAHSGTEDAMWRIWSDYETQNHGSMMTPSYLHSFPVGSHNMHMVEPDSLNNLSYDHNVEDNSDTGQLFGSYNLLGSPSLENQWFSFISKDAIVQSWEPASTQLEKDLITFKNPSKAKDKEVSYENHGPTIEIPQLEHRMSGEDLRKIPTLKPQLDLDFYSNTFQTHKPTSLCASLAAYLASRLVKRIFQNLRPILSKKEISEFGEVWNSETVLPFVYFQILANPSPKMWTRVETIMGVICRIYHKEYLFHNGTIDFETLAKFLVWHAGIFQQMIKPVIPLDLGTKDDLNPDLFPPNKTVHSLARIFSTLHSKGALDTFFIKARWDSRDVFAKKHLSSIWENDVKKGYLNKPRSEGVEEGVWKNWVEKSEEIEKTIKDRWCWENLALYSKQNSAKSIKLLNDQIEKGENARMNPNFPWTVKLIFQSLESSYNINQNLQIPSNKFSSRAIAYFFDDYLSERNPELWGVTKDDNHVTLLATFFHLIDSESEFKIFRDSYNNDLKQFFEKHREGYHQKVPCAHLFYVLLK
ncbi:hypothetical protein CROQUDRAFT_131340 [Cronartium quercuum f. sp. fusiforme G11]|uniref:Uncharacterized protein n=1 Tax=Cronartium quercuum f. sp. fusiforme G11 TaxID=708437 RepID=A0A9P6NSH9_9BASI|nr:hypothetical protein CROQUDRAFT_131340 [Cronartium quercuum f. sp. fusiforme G11]